MFQTHKRLRHPTLYIELFARGKRKNWNMWGNQVNGYQPNWPTYSHNSSNLHKDNQQSRLLETNANYIDK